VLRQEWCFY